MIRISAYLLLAVFAVGMSTAQNLQNIVDHDPFDVMRGKVIVEAPEPEEPVVVPINLPILDGTIIAGDKRIALLTLTDAGNAKSTRVALNQKFAQYTVTSIERNTVTLKNNSGAPIKLTLYSGKKENRGGTKVVAQPKATKPGRGDKGGPQINLHPNDPTQPKELPEKDINRTKEQRQDLRRPPRQPRGENNRLEDAKKRF